MTRKSSLGGQNIYALKGAYLKSGIQDQGFLVGPNTMGPSQRWDQGTELMDTNDDI